MCNSAEESYTLLDCEHKKGTNKYVFTFSPHWRRTNQKALTIAVRSVKQILSTRAIWFEDIELADGINPNINISPDISLSENWCHLNYQLEDFRIKQFDIYKLKNPSSTITFGDWIIGYDEENSMFNIMVNRNISPNGRLIVNVKKDSKDQQVKQISQDLLAMCSFEGDDLKLIRDLSDLSKGNIDKETFDQLHQNDPIEVEVEEGDLIRISLKNIWNRDTLAIHASFVDLSYRQWLGSCNEHFIPPKEYPITFDDQKFWIELFTLDGRPVELPPDNKDQIIIEAMQNSYV